MGGECKKKAMREQRKIEKAFFATIGDEAVTYVREWYDEVGKIAKMAVAVSVLSAQACVREQKTTVIHPKKGMTHIEKSRSMINVPDQSRCWDPGGFAWKDLVTRLSYITEQE